MEARLTFRSEFPINVKPEVFTCGGYAGKDKNGNTICFDWDQWAGNSDFDEQGHWVVEVNHQLFASVYDDEYREIGLDPKDVTAEFLTKLKLTEIAYECFLEPEEETFVPLILTSFEIDGHAFSPEQIAEYYKKPYDKVIEALGRKGMPEDEQLYILSVADMASVMDGDYDERVAGMSDDQLLDLAIYIRSKLEIPWDEYMRVTIESYFHRQD